MEKLNPIAEDDVIFIMACFYLLSQRWKHVLLDKLNQSVVMTAGC